MILPRNVLVQLPRAEDALNLMARATRCRYTDRYGRCRSTWSQWGRWLLAGILILIGLTFVFLILCCRRRRMRKSRRNMTSAPMVPPANTGYNQGYDNQYAPPPGGPPQYGNQGYNNSGYYGQQNGVAQPQNAYVK